MEAEEKGEAELGKTFKERIQELNIKPLYSQDITKLRKEGKLEAAYELAIKALSEEPENIWNKRAAAWVHYEYLKRHISVEEFESFKDHLIKIKELQLPIDETMVFDQCAWQVSSMVFALQKSMPADYSKINAIYNVIKDFHFTKQTKSYSVLFNAFHKGRDQWNNYLDFVDWWGLENFIPEDFIEEEYHGRSIMALAEQAYIGYAKKLLEGKSLDGFGAEYKIDKDKIQDFLPKIDQLIENHPEYKYPPYFKAKMLIALGGNKAEILAAFLPFAKQNKNMFWVWGLIAEIFYDNADLQFACYCKALSIKTPDSFLIKLRQTFASILIVKKMFAEAKTEIENIIAVRSQNEWRMTGQLRQWTEQDWYRNAEAKKDNSDLYAAHLQQAEEILFADLPEVIVAVEFVNKNKSMIHFVQNKAVTGFFKYDKKVLNPEIGDLLSVRLGEASESGFYKIFIAKSAEAEATSEVLKSFSGNLRVISPQNFGFADNVFIHQQIIEANNLKDGQPVEGTAILSFNKRKDEWGWKACKLS